MAETNAKRQDVKRLGPSWSDIRLETVHLKLDSLEGVEKTAVLVTWCRRTRVIQVGGTTRAAWAPTGHASSILWSMKQLTLLWYWNRAKNTETDVHRNRRLGRLSKQTFRETDNQDINGNRRLQKQTFRTFIETDV